MTSEELEKQDENPEKIMSLFETNIHDENATIFLGLSNDLEQNAKIYEIAEKFAAEHKMYIIFCGAHDSIPESELKKIKKNPKQLKSILIETEIGDFPFSRGSENVNPSEISQANYTTDKITKIDDYLKILYSIFDQIVEIIKENSGLGGIIKIISWNPEKIVLGTVFFEKMLRKLLEKDEETEELIAPCKKYLKNISGIRGSLPSAPFLKYLMNILLFIRRDIYEQVRISRLSILESIDGVQFFFAPVGIDEANNFEKKKKIISDGDKLLHDFKIKPIISVLSGGRSGDIGRDSDVDKSLKEAQLLVEYFTKEKDMNYIYNDNILIENSIKRKATFIIAPSGMSGNLIYRTLVHLGGGKAFGAIYSTILFRHNVVLIDSSRNAREPEILGSLILATGLLGLKSKNNSNSE